MGFTTSLIRTVTPAAKLLFFGLLAMAGVAEAATVKAYVQPERARPNQVITYIITVQDGQVNGIPDLRLPLQITQNTTVSTSQQFAINNGRQTSSIRLTWGIAASEPGDFVIPAQTIRVDNQDITTNEVKLTVEQGGSGFPKAGDGDDRNQPILQIELGKKEIYQGEVMPVTCSLYVPRQTQIRRLGLIDIEKSDFAIARFPQQSDQTMTVIDGIGYIVLTFRSTLSSLRTGDLKVGPASMEILVEVPVEGGQQRPNMFPPGFPQGFFGVQTEPRKVEVKSQQVTLKVLPLPTENKPANFSGAVGDFALSATATPTELTVGDPVAVEMIVEGTGNFDALTTPALTAPSGWKSYPAKRYNVEGQLDQNQVPTLERKIGYSQVFIPEAVHTALPPFEMNYFSPARKEYVVLRTDAIALNMKPAPATATSEVSPGTAVEAGAPPPALDPQPDITDILVRPAGTSRWLAPTGALLIRSSTFWTAQALPLGLLFLASVFAVIRRRNEKRMAGGSGEVRAAWAALEDRGIDDKEFLRRAVQFIQVAKAGAPVSEQELKDIQVRYETYNFTAVQEGAVSQDERRKITSSLNGLLSKALSKASVLLLFALLAYSNAMAQSAKAAVSPDETYAEAVKEMEKGNFAKAQYLAESLTKKKPPQLSPEVFQLIGHARYRQEDLGRAVLWYQRAQLFDTRSPELRQNLRHLYEKLRFLSFGQRSPVSQLSLYLTPNEWLLTATAGLWLVALSVAWRLFAGRKALGAAITLFILGLVIAVPASAFAALRPPGAERVRDISIVTVSDVRAYTGASVTSGTVMDLPPGSQVRVLEKRGAWSYVEIPGQPENLRGWVEGGAITPLWAWEEAMVP